MERSLTQIYQVLQKLIGLHRQLLDTVRMEHQSLVQAELKAIEEAVYAKQALIEAIRAAENERIKALSELSVVWKKPIAELTLSKIIIAVQGRDPKFAEQVRSTLHALNILIKRVSDQNQTNRGLVDRALENVHMMKRNILGEAAPKKDVYNQKGHRATAQTAPRLLSREV